MEVYTIQDAFGDFLLYFTKTYPHFNLESLLATLQINSVINSNDRAILDQERAPAERARILFRDLIPSKTKESHYKLVDVLRGNRFTDLADHLAANLAKAGTPLSMYALSMPQMREVYQTFLQQHPEYSYTNIRALLPLLIVDGVITVDEKEIIEHDAMPSSRLMTFFLNIMPSKDQRCHLTFIKILKNCNQVDVAKWFEENIPKAWLSQEAAKKSKKQITEIYDKFFASFQKDKSADINILLPKLRLCNVIDDSESNLIRSKIKKDDQASLIFLQIMPSKDYYCHSNLVKILEESNLNNLAEFLAQRLNQQHVFQLEIEMGRSVDQKYLVDGFSYTSQAYENELGALDEIPITRGVLRSVNIQCMTKTPYDIEDIDYYSNFSVFNELHGEFEPKGLALVISNQKYHDSKIYQTRCNSDSANMVTLIAQLGYDVQQEYDRTAAEMLNDVKNFVALFNQKRQDGQQLKSCIVTILAYGLQGKFVGFDGKFVTVKEFFEPFAGLNGIPKLFIVQSCRGSNANPRMLSDDDDTKQELLSIVKTSEKSSKKAFKDNIPEIEDMCIIYSTTPGYFSWREQERGSWFIQTVCEVISTHAHKHWADFPTLFKLIIKSLKEKWQRRKDYIEMPKIIDTMEKKFHFFPACCGNRSDKTSLNMAYYESKVESVFVDFCKYLNENYPRLGFDTLLSTLEIHLIITAEEAPRLTGNSAADKVKMLFHSFIPSRGPECHRALVEVLRKYYPLLAQNLDDRLEQIRRF